MTRRRRASAAPRARRCCNRAPQTSSCVRRSCRRKTRGLMTPPNSADVTAPCGRPAALPATTPAQSEPTRRPRESRRAASESSTLIARRGPRRSCADLVLPGVRYLSPSRRSRPCRTLCTPRLRPCCCSASHRAGSLEPTRRRRASAAPRARRSATERRRPRRACAGLVVGKREGLVTPPNSVDVTAPCGRCAALPATAPALLSRHGDGERAPRREPGVAATERRRPRRACAGLVVGKRGVS